MIVPVLRLKLSDFLGTDYETEVLDKLREINNKDYMPPFEIYLWYDRDNDKVELTGIAINENCPLIDTELRNIHEIFQDEDIANKNLRASIVSILRNNKLFIPNKSEKLLLDDKVYLLIDKSHVDRTMAAFGLEEKPISKLLIIGGALFLIYCGIASWRIIASSIIGLVFTAFLFNLLSGFSTNAMLTITPLQHLLIGSFLFGTVFMATEPVTSSHTNTGRWIYGFLIGVLTVIIRSINPAYPEGVMLAILIMNMFAPLIDYYVIQSNIKMRLARNV